jgi:glycosyltransferase involved in cell wall biosynthesis
MRGGNLQKSEKVKGVKMPPPRTTHDSLPAEMAQSCQNGIKVLHVLFRLDPGGVETWLMQVLRNLDCQRFKIDFLVHTSQKGIFDDEATALGAKILICPESSRLWAYPNKFLTLVKENGPYQIIHSHLPLSGFILFLARWTQIPIRIYHCHNDETIRRKKVSWRRRFFLCMSNRLIHRYATHGLAVSRLTAFGNFGPDWESDGRWQILPAINDPAPFMIPVNRRKIRGDLGLPDSAFVLGHVGRFMAQKNHDFLIDIAAEVCCRLPNAHFLLVGDGPLRPTMEDKVARLGLTRQVTFMGIRTDVPRLMRGAMDAFIFPSLYEGMGMVVLEAQAAGLPCLITDTIPEEGTIIPELVRRVALRAGARGWAKAVLELGYHCGPMSVEEVRRRIQGSLFDLQSNVLHLEELYATALTSQSQISKR